MRNEPAKEEEMTRPFAPQKPQVPKLGLAQPSTTPTPEQKIPRHEVAEYDPGSKYQLSGMKLIGSKQYSGSQQETECLKQSLKNEAYLQSRYSNVRRTPSKGPPNQNATWVPPPNPDDPRNQPTSAVPEDLMTVLEVYAKSHPGKSWKPVRPPSPPRVGNAGMPDEAAKARLRERTMELMKSNPPPRERPPVDPSPNPGATHYGSSRDEFGHKYGRKYEYREKGEEEMGYESGDSSRSENSVASTRSSQYSY